VLLLAAATGAPAEPVYSFEATPGKLPKTVVPTHYAIELEPSLEGLTFAGTEVVDIEVREPTARLVLNALNLALVSATVDNEAQTAAIALDAATETAVLTFPQPLAVGAHKLRIGFTGQINKFGRGLFFVDYPTDKGTRRMLSSHLEPADARRVFPCWDEPAFKATFALTVTVPRTFLAVGNMPVAHEEPVTPTLKQVRFLPTPKMSSYLFVLAVGELERLSAQFEGVTVSVVTTSGKRDQGRFALDSAVGLLRYFNDYFGVKYPLPKLDLIAVPGGFSGAMENWGGITFFESRLLFDPTSNAAGVRRGIFSVLAHEMAHQWFGNLVTMAWWDNLWLNEGLASWMQVKAADRFYPQWRSWLNGSGQKQFAMNLDARRTSRPIQQPVANETEAMAVFDGITYSKGQAVIRMLENYLGEDVFRAGIRGYMTAHAYGNSTTADLWRALEAASGKPVAAIAAGFTEQAGLPLIIAEVTCSGDEQRVRLRQDRFTTRDAAATPTPPSPASAGGTGRGWQVPVAVGPLRALRPSTTVLLQDRDEVAAGRCGEPVKLNLGDFGYYRVEYDATSRAALVKSFALMAPADRVNLLADSWALVEAGRAEPQSYLELVEEIGSDDNLAVWEQVIRTLTRLDWLARDRTERQTLRAYVRAKLRPVFDRLGWDANGRGSDDGALLRARLIRVLGDLGDEQVLAEAKRRFAAFLQNPAALRPGLREPVTHLVGIGADRKSYDTLLSLARKSTSTSERVRYYSAAASARDPALARDTLELTLTDELPSNLVGSVINTVASAGEQPDVAWAFVRRNFQALANKQGPSFRNYFVANFMTNFNDAAHAAELADFAPAHATSGGKMVAARAHEGIMIGADVKARVLPVIDDWIKQRPTPN
jgi:aminopeptidase N